MNELILKKACIFALIFGATIGLISLIPSLFPLMTFIILPFLSSISVIIFMKKDQKQLGVLDNQQGAIMGAFVGFFSGVGFFITLSPMVAIIHLINKSYYTYGIVDCVSNALWLFGIIVLMVCLTFAALNSVSAMGLTYLLSKIEPEQKDYDSQVEIEIND